MWTQDKIDQLMAVMAGKSNHIDSCCLDTSSNAEKVRTELQAQGLNLKTLGATSWKYEVKNGKKYLFWTDYNIAVLPAGTKIPVIQYNASSGNYSVWTMSVNSYTDPTYGKYNVINITGTPYSPSTSTSANGNQTLAKAQEYYKQLKSSMK